MHRQHRPWIAALGLALMSGGAAHAGSVSSSSTILTSVFDSCLMSTATDVKFGNYDTTGATDAAATNSYSVICTLNTLVTVTATSANKGVLVGPGQDKLTYTLYRDASHTVPFGTGYQVRSQGILSPVGGTLYGVVPAHQDVRPGAYSDAVTLTFSY